ncbi:MAG: FtsQ-type POTRA domain-containing protein [Methylovirgula sp.]|uniref:cell division protein FtsQ/DivIB n=1 Tax=Methylovirgula sp. TaxID=1978224 RepID=UPI003075FB99
MDGGRRLLRPVREAFEGFQPSAPVHAGVVHIAPALVFSADYGRRASGRRVSSSANRVLALFIVPGVGTLVALLLFIGVGLYGAWLGGEYSTFVTAEGSVPDYAARVAGFAIRTITISGAHALTEQEVITASGVGPKNSLPFLDVQAVRARLRALPMVKDASITKLFPGHVVIDVEERKPYALWQMDGTVKIVAVDGTAIDTYDDQRFAALPLVVGTGANARLDEYVALLDAAGDLRTRIKAGILVAQRRWTLKIDNQVEVALPEIGAAAAIAELARMQREDHILDKDILSVDLRVPGRMFIRLSENAAAERAAALAQKSKLKGART